MDLGSKYATFIVFGFDILILMCRWALQATLDTSSALAYLHDNNIMHGDVYAHNMLADASGKTVLCDYGASFFYPDDQQQLWEAVEVRTCLADDSSLLSPALTAHTLSPFVIER